MSLRKKNIRSENLAFNNKMALKKQKKKKKKTVLRLTNLCLNHQISTIFYGVAGSDTKMISGLRKNTE